MKLQIVAALGLTLFSMSAFAVSAKPGCAGCATLVEIEAKYAKLDPKDDEKGIELSNAASKAIGELPTLKNRKLSNDQIMEISRLLIVAHPTDQEDALIDNNIKLFNANKVAFFKIFKSFSAKEEEDLRISLDSKLGEYYYGNDPDSTAANRKNK